MSCPLVHPFNDPSADVVLVSSDDMAFKLHRIILSLGSDFFKAMFSLSQPKPLDPGDPQVDESKSTADAEIDGLPVIRVSEPGEVLNKLFRLCYPIDDPPLEMLDEVAAVLTAALKYELRKPIQMASRRMRKLMPTASLRVYAIACRLDLEDEARAAAMVVREKKLQDEYVAELEDISIGAYHRLLYYCETGRDPGGLFFTRSSIQGAHRGKRKNKKSKSASVSHPSDSIPLLQPSARPAIAPVVRPPIVGGYPFNIVGPELTIKTSDGTRFGLSRSFLELASPVLFEMARNSPSPSTIHIPESSEVVDIILRVCSPVENPSVTDLPVLDSALVAATKYQMKKTIHFLQEALIGQADAPTTDHFLLYTIACRHDMRGLALTAAKRTLRMGLTNALHPAVEAIDISAGFLYRLLEHHRRCRDAVRTMFAADSWIEQDWRSRFVVCSRGSSLPCWYSRYMQNIGREEWPGPHSVAKEDALTAALASSYPYGYGCGNCLREQGAVLLFKFSEYVAATMAKLENEVILEWPSQDPSPSA